MDKISREKYEVEHTISRMIGDTTETIKVYCLWPDIDIYMQQEYTKDDKVIAGSDMCITLDSADKLIELLKRVKDEAQERVDEYVAYCEKEELKESESDANTDNIRASTDDFETLQLDRY